jgi:GTP-binding protein HflX
LEKQETGTAEKAVLIGVELPDMTGEKVENSLQELARLTETAGAQVADVQIQRRKRPHPATFIGPGKAEELKDICAETGAGMIICDREISPGQANNLQGITEVKVLDRTQLILDIFAGRARTREGKLQVELAQLEYMLPRLMGIGAQLSRLGGGIGTRGPGETKLEIDRRRIRKRIADLKGEIVAVRRHRDLLRRGRKEIPVPLVSLVGYTNAGKSTLLNTLTGAQVLVEDKLFATLDPTTRRVKLTNNQEVLFTDTVGFIQNLPHHLVAAFRATLEEVVEADLLLHVVDASHPGYPEQIEAVNEVLDSLEVGGKPVVMVFNKMDVATEAQVLPDPGVPWVALSARTGEGLDRLLAVVEDVLGKERKKVKFTIPYSKSSVLDIVHRKGMVLSQKHGEDGVIVEAEMDQVWVGRVKSKLKGRN